MENELFTDVLRTAIGYRWSFLGAVLVSVMLGYVVYMRFMHPLARYPGPFIASLTNLWKAYTMYQGRMEYVIHDLHERHGAIVRIGPNDLVISHPDAVKQIYLAGSSFQKTKFYNGFTSFRPNVFGTQDEAIHSIRRRQLSHSFSLVSILQMEPYIDSCLSQLIDQLDKYAARGDIVDLKMWIRLYIFDVLGELAFSQSFGALKTANEDLIPPVTGHVQLSTVAGQIPEYTTQIIKMLAYAPIPWIQNLYKGRTALKDLTAQCVNNRIAKRDSKRMDLLARLIEAKDPQTGKMLDLVDIQTEAFGMMVAGSHTTATTMTFLFYHILHSPRVMEKLVQELDASDPGTRLSFMEGMAENTYFQACIKENLRYTPVFVMPLPRRVPDGGCEIAGELIPAGTTVSVVNHALHRNKKVYGPDADKYIPERWMNPARAAELDRYLIAFSAGHRSCAGRNMALVNIQKVVATVLRRYHIEAVDEKEELSTYSVGVSEKEGPLLCRISFRK